MFKKINCKEIPIIADNLMPENQFFIFDSENISYVPKENKKATIKSMFKEIKYRIGLAYDCLRNGRNALD